MKIASFDFDDTLCRPDGSPHPPGVALFRQHTMRGDACIIVTARNPEHESVAWAAANQPGRVLIADFLAAHGMAAAGVHFTNHADKGPTLRRLGVTVHYDDCPEHAASCAECGVECVRVDV